MTEMKTYMKQKKEEESLNLLIKKTISVRDSYGGSGD
jgi:hypothetical protein